MRSWSCGLSTRRVTAARIAAQKAAAKERDRLKATAVKSAAVAISEAPLQAANPPVPRHARDTRVELDPLTGYGRDGARGTIVDIRGDDYRVRLDSGKVVDVSRRIVVPLLPEEAFRCTVAATSQPACASNHRWTGDGRRLNTRYPRNLVPIVRFLTMSSTPHLENVMASAPVNQHQSFSTGNTHIGGIVRRRVGRLLPTAERGVGWAARTSVNTRP